MASFQKAFWVFMYNAGYNFCSILTCCQLMIISLPYMSKVFQGVVKLDWGF